jgi:hypothetical protein
MIAETFALSEEHCFILSDIICHQTGGNVLCVMGFMTWLEDEGLLRFKEGSWKWDEQEIRLYLSNVIEFVTFLWTNSSVFRKMYKKFSR